MYSRSYGMIEQSEKSNIGFSVPPDYNGNLYRKEEKPEIKRPEVPREEPRAEEKMQIQGPSFQEEKKPPASSGIAGSFLERLTAEDILLFVFLYSLLRGDSEDSGNILGLILALLLL